MGTGRGRETRGSGVTSRTTLVTAGLRSKLALPITGSSLQRNGLAQWVSQALSSQLTVIHGPAGSGKTTLMTQLAARLTQHAVRTSWLTVDDADNERARFLAYLAAAISEHETGKFPVSGVGSDNFSPYEGEGLSELWLERVLRWAADDSSGGALFLDDFEVIHDPDALNVVKRLVANLSPERHLIIASRSIPELRLARVRVRGQLLEIKPDDLRFAWDETVRFLQQERGLDLADEDLARLYGRTEGWAAGLQLSARALAGSADRGAMMESLSGSFSQFADYLAEEVVSRQPERVRDFLLATSILEKLSGPLCTKVTGYDDSPELLSYLEHTNLFLSPLNEQRHWYRYHQLFAEFLRTQAERTIAARLPELHQRAADWLEAEGTLLPAAEHALAGGDAERAAGLVARCAMTQVQIGRLRTVTGWVARLPSSALDRHPELRLALCWAHAMRNEHVKAAEVLAEIVCGLGDAATADPVVLDQIRALEPVVLSLTDQVHECLELAEKNLPKVSDHDSWSYGVLENCLAGRLIESGRFEEASVLLDEAYRKHVDAGRIFGAMYSSCHKGVLELLRGHLVRAVELYRDALTHAGSGAVLSQTSAVAAVYLAEACYEMDEIDEAERLLVLAHDRFRECVPLDVMLLGFLTLSRVHTVRGEHRVAAALLDEAEAAGQERQTPRASATVTLERMRLAVCRDDLDEATRLAAEVKQDPVWKGLAEWSMPASDVETPAVGALRLLIRKGEADRAIPRLRAELTQADRSGHGRRALKLRILLAEALEKEGDSRAAARTMIEALSSGRQEGFVRAFADEGPTVLALVDLVGDASSMGEYSERILGAGRIGADRLNRTRPRPGDEVPAEPLTERERAVLEMVASGLSNNQLAARMFVTVPTVKFHLRNINAKLRVNSRTAAVARGRELGLLS